MYPVHTFPPYSNITPHLLLGIPNDLFPSGFPTKILYVFFTSLMRATWLAHFIILALITLKIFGEAYNFKKKIGKLSLCFN
jgi:hypothetical protein